MPGTFFDSLSMRFEEGKLLSQRFMKYFVFGCTCLSLVYLSLTCRMKKSNAKKQSWLKKKKGWGWSQIWECVKKKAMSK